MDSSIGIGETISMILTLLNLISNVTATVLQYCEYRSRKRVSTTRYILPS